MISSCALDRTSDLGGLSENDLTFVVGSRVLRARLARAPQDAIVVHALGIPTGRSISFIAVGEGRVLFHGGNDLWQFSGAESAGWSPAHAMDAVGGDSQ